MPVADEVLLPDLVDVDRRQLLAAADGLGDPLPAGPATPGCRAELRVEVTHLVDRADDLVEGDDLDPEVALPELPQGADDLVERERRAVAAEEPAAEAAHPLLAAHPQEVGLGIRAGRSGVSGHGGSLLR